RRSPDVVAHAAAGDHRSLRLPARHDRARGVRTAPRGAPRRRARPRDRVARTRLRVRTLRAARARLRATVPARDLLHPDLLPSTRLAPRDRSLVDRERPDRTHEA